MQVSATLIAAQAAAREAQARFRQVHAPQAGFAAALGETGKTEGFSPLTLKQTAPAPQAQSEAAPQPPGAANATRPGTFLDITI